MQLFEDNKRSTRSRVVLRGGVQPAPQKLSNLGDWAAATEVDSYFMKAVGMQDCEVDVPRLWLRTYVSQVVELYAQPKVLQRNLGIRITHPLLRQQSAKRGAEKRYETLLPQ